MKRVLSVFACILLLCPSLVFADNMKKDDSVYFSLSGMVAVAEDSTLKLGGSEAELELDTGFGVSVAAGKKFGNGWRGEVEYAYQNNGVGRGKVKIGDISGEERNEIAMALGFSLSDAELEELNENINDLGLSYPGELSGLEDPDLHFFMVNGVYDITNSGPVTPYLGAGIGIGWEEEAEGTEFAYQFLAGISYEVSSRNELILGYRYRGMTDLDFKITGTDIEYTATADSHNFEIGFRHSF